MTDAYTYKPVIRLPKRKPSVIQALTPESIQGDLLDLKAPLVSDTLFLGTLPYNIKESDIRTLLQHCMPTEIIFDTEKNIGQLRFSGVKIADRAYSLYNGFTFTNNAKLELQMYQDGSLDPEATAGLLQINNLPDYFDDNKLYDVFRPFGPLNLCKCIMRDGIFDGTAFIQFFKQKDSDEAERKLNGQLIQDHEISVLPILPSNHSTSTSDTQTAHAVGAPKEAEEKQESPVDYMNLYIKNLEPNITNQDLSQAFRRFGRIISARVMTNPTTGQSKGYGFVSFGRPEEASAALYEMNGYMLNNRPLIVAYHEPKKGGGSRPNNNNNNNLNNYNNTPVNNLNSYNNTPLNNNNSNYTTTNTTATTTSTLRANVDSYTPSSSYYDTNRSHVDMRSMNVNYHQPPPHQQQQQLHLQQQQQQQQHQSQHHHGLELDNVESLAMKDLSIDQKPTTINLPSKKSNEAMQHVNIKLSPQFSSSPMSGTSGTGKSLASLASGFSIQQPPLHLQQQQQQQQQSVPRNNNTNNGRPTLRRRGSLESVMTESSANVQRIKLEAAVRSCGDYGKITMDIVDMLLTLKRKERSLCLFNPDFLKQKVQLALDALNTCEDDSDEELDEEEDQEGRVEELGFPVDYLKSRSNSSANIYKSYNMGRPSLPVQPPRRESKAIAITAPPAPSSTSNTTTTPATSAAAIAAATAAKAAAISSLSNGTATTTTTNTTTEASKKKESTTSASSSSANAKVNKLLSSLEGKPIHEKKQLLGDELFPLVKATGTKQAPKVTICLLDSVDLVELAEIMYDPSSLKKRVEEAFVTLQQQQ